MNRLRNKYFSVNIVFYNYRVIMQRQNMLLSVVKNNWNGNFADFIDLEQKNRFYGSGLILLQSLVLLLVTFS